MCLRQRINKCHWVQEFDFKVYCFKKRCRKETSALGRLLRNKKRRKSYKLLFEFYFSYCYFIFLLFIVNTRVVLIILCHFFIIFDCHTFLITFYSEEEETPSLIFRESNLSDQNKRQFFYFRYEPLPSFLSKIGYALHFICLNTKFLFHVSKFVLFDSRVLLKNFAFCPS